MFLLEKRWNNDHPLYQSGPFLFTRAAIGYCVLHRDYTSILVTYIHSYHAHRYKLLSYSGLEWTKLHV